MLTLHVDDHIALRSRFNAFTVHSALWEQAEKAGHPSRTRILSISLLAIR
jgi:hypothetical protein